MEFNESTGAKDPRHEEGIAYDYTHPSDNKGPELRTLNERDVQAVYDALADRVGGEATVYCKSTTIAETADLSTTVAGQCIRALADTPDCPLAIERWNGESTTPAVWRVERAGTTVYRATGQTTGRVLHSAKDCWQLQRADSVTEKPLAAFPDPTWCSHCGPPEGVERELVADGGAIDNDFDESERSPREQLIQTRWGLATDATTHGDGLHPGDVAIDLVTRQPLYVRSQVADDLPTYYEQEGFDLYNYKQHPYLPVTLDDAVYECVFIGGVDDLHNFSDTYDYPAGRLARVPVGLAGGDE